jgi:hypothetical protein
MKRVESERNGDRNKTQKNCWKTPNGSFGLSFIHFPHFRSFTADISLPFPILEILIHLLPLFLSVPVAVFHLALTSQPNCS